MAKAKPLRLAVISLLVVVMGFFWLAYGNPGGRWGSYARDSLFGPRGFLTRLVRTFTWQTYKSEEYAFKVKHPRGWTVTEDHSEYDRYISVTKDDYSAFVAIKSYKDQGLREPGALQNVLVQKETELRSDPSFSIESFESKVGETRGGYLVRGTVTPAEGFQMRFEEKGLYGIYGKVLLMHGAARPEVFDQEYANLVGIMDSFEVW